MDEQTLALLLQCFGLSGLHDKRSFKKRDLVALETVKKINHMKDILEQFYLPCKFKVYIANINEKKAITVLRQVLRLFNYHIASRECNINNKKMIFYTVESDKEIENNTNILRDQRKTLYFD